MNVNNLLYIKTVSFSFYIICFYFPPHFASMHIKLCNKHWINAKEMTTVYARNY